MTDTSIPQSYFDYQVSQFYGHLFKCLNEWNEIYHGRVNDSWCQEMIKIAAREWNSFADYWTYALYRDCGVKRRYHRYGADLAVDETEEGKYLSKFFGKTRGFLVQLFYDKTLSGYNKANPVSQLCRHLVFDMNSMSIVSLGITKALDIEMFAHYVGCNPLDTENPNNKAAVIVEPYLEGTMIVYNPRLETFKMATLTKQHEDEDAEEVRVPKTWTVSTRKSLGTSFFNNPGKTFQSMFDENMVAQGIQLSGLPESYTQNHILVFNTEHVENRIIDPAPTNRNTLVAVYKLSCDDYMSGEKVNELLTALAQSKAELFGELYSSLVAKQLRIVELNDAVTELKELGIVVTTPHLLCELSFSNLLHSHVVNAFIAGMNEFCPGIMIKSAGGLRTKVRNPKYTELLNLKGNTPISIHSQNKKNLFKLFWHLRKAGNEHITKFLDVFDTDAKNYMHIFDWYKNCIHMMTQNLFMEYMTVFVEKKRHASTVPYEFKPLVGELHKLYNATKQATTKTRVIEFVNGMEWNQVYWRIFGTEN
jgi:hypothetical protein